MELLTDDLVVEIMLNADGAVWVDKVGAGMLRTGVRMAAAKLQRGSPIVSSAIECTRRRTPQARPWSYGGLSSRKRG
jgi:Flp pilus assembly CpaF family ATPase